VQVNLDISTLLLLLALGLLPESSQLRVPAKIIPTTFQSKQYLVLTASFRV